MANNYSPEENLLSGIKKIVVNACDLLDDAALMYERKKYERAFGFYQLSINEINEAYGLLRELLFFDTSSGNIPEMNYFKEKSQKDDNSWIINNILTSIMKKMFPQLNMHASIMSTHRSGVWQEGLCTQMHRNSITCPKESISKTDADKKRDDACKEVTDKQQLITYIASNYSTLKARISELDLYSE